MYHCILYCIHVLIVLRAAAQPPSVPEVSTTDPSSSDVHVRIARLALANKLNGRWKALEDALHAGDIVGAGKVCFHLPLR